MKGVKDSALDNVANFLLPWLSNSNRYFLNFQFIILDTVQSTGGAEHKGQIHSHTATHTQTMKSNAHRLTHTVSKRTSLAAFTVPNVQFPSQLK